MKRYIVQVFVLTLAFAASAQEILRIDATEHPSQERLRPIVKASGSTSVGGIIDGSPTALPLILSIREIKPFSNTSQPGSTGYATFEIRLANVSGKQVLLPVDPNRDTIIDRCGKAAILQSHLSLYVRENDGDTSPLPLSGDLFGCDKRDGLGVVTLNDGEWITYTGSISLPAGDASSHNVTASWLLADVNYSKSPDGLIEDAKTRLTLTTPERKTQK